MTCPDITSLGLAYQSLIDPDLNVESCLDMSWLDLTCPDIASPDLTSPNLASEHSKYSNLFGYSNIFVQIFDIRIWIYLNFWTLKKLGYEFIRTFINFLQIYSNILLCKRVKSLSKLYDLGFQDYTATRSNQPSSCHIYENVSTLFQWSKIMF